MKRTRSDEWISVSPRGKQMRGGTTSGRHGDNCTPLLTRHPPCLHFISERSAASACIATRKPKTCGFICSGDQEEESVQALVEWTCHQQPSRIKENSGIFFNNTSLILTYTEVWITDEHAVRVIISSWCVLKSKLSYFFFRVIVIHYAEDPWKWLIFRFI